MKQIHPSKMHTLTSGQHERHFNAHLKEYSKHAGDDEEKHGDQLMGVLHHLGMAAHHAAHGLALAKTPEEKAKWIMRHNKVAEEVRTNGEDEEHGFKP